MKRTLLFALASFVWFGLLNGSLPEDPKSLSRQFQLRLGPEEWGRLGDPEDFRYDLIVLRDGSRIWGWFDTVPALTYPFGRVSFKVEELAAVAFAGQGPSGQVQYVTKNGQNYIGLPSQGGYVYKERIEVEEVITLRKEGKADEIEKNVKSSNEYLIPNLLDPESVEMVIFAPRKNKKKKVILGKPLVSPLFYSVILQKGDRFPAELTDYDWQFTKGNQSQSVRTDQIIQLELNPSNGVVIKTNERELPQPQFYDGIEQLTLNLRLAKDGEKLSIPWQEIKEIRADMGSFILTTPYLFGQPYIGSMTFIPSGSFIMGSNLSDEERVPSYPPLLSQYPLSSFSQAQYFTSKNLFPTRESPSELISLPGYYMDQFEVTNEQYARFIRASGYPAPSHWQEGIYSRGAERLPVVNISYEDAAAYAAWAGKRLPTEEEWERAAKGPLGFRYPYGDHFDPLLANVRGEGVLPVGTFAPFQKKEAFSPMDQPFKLFDLSGNVAEWTATIYSKTVERSRLSNRKSYLVPPNGKHLRVIRGGSYKSSAQTATTVYRSFRLESDYANDVGFRCVWQPPQTR